MLYIIILSLLICLPAQARIINVPDDFETIQAGIDDAEDGDTVLVAPGEYRENIVFTGHGVILGSRILVTGDNAYIDSTIIDGQEEGSVILVEQDGSVT